MRKPIKPEVPLTHIIKRIELARFDLDELPITFSDYDESAKLEVEYDYSDVVLVIYREEDVVNPKYNIECDRYLRETNLYSEKLAKYNEWVEKGPVGRAEEKKRERARLKIEKLKAEIIELEKV